MTLKLIFDFSMLDFYYYKPSFIYEIIFKYYNYYNSYNDLFSIDINM